MYLVDEVEFSVPLAELVLGVHEYQTALGGHLGASLEESEGIVLELGVVFG